MLVAPAGLNPIREGDRMAGEVLPVRHYGSVDVFLEAYESASGGEVLVIDNGGRTDESCIGDLTVLEAQAAGISGILVWGLHRDSAELTEIDSRSSPTGRFLQDRSASTSEGPTR
jgi:4-hydroxy-4-methyl-2-oxoglutarate aldolase